MKPPSGLAAPDVGRSVEPSSGNGVHPRRSPPLVPPHARGPKNRTEFHRRVASASVVAIRWVCESTEPGYFVAAVDLAASNEEATCSDSADTRDPRTGSSAKIVERKQEVLTMIGIYIVTKNMTIEQHTKGRAGCRRLVHRKAR